MDPYQEANGRSRVIIEGVGPQVDGGRYAVKRVLGEEVQVQADIFADGHDLISAAILYRHQDEAQWRETEMVPLTNDRWQASFAIERLGRYEYTLLGWIDHLKTWRRDLEKKWSARQDVTVDLLNGARLVEAALSRGERGGNAGLRAWLESWQGAERGGLPERVARALDPQGAARLHPYSDRGMATRHPVVFPVVADPVIARTGAWYECFPRSCGSDGQRHGSFRDVEAQLPRIAKMGFDVLYLPPIHPIGDSYRKGRNNATEALAGDPGSPWAIGSKEGGHKAIHAHLGTVEDFRQLVVRAKENGLSLALDIAFQCSPDHPYVREHPEWFKKRADDSIQYAENPPKKYQDIYPFDFECAAWESLWQELKGVMEFWVQQGVTLFRVDNPHTKAFPFWEWVIGELKSRNPELVFLAEAFTRPKVMYNLAKLGFSQSYNYFPWRNTGPELRQFMTELTRSTVREFYRPNLWPNTPDILPQYLQFGGRAGFAIRVVLAATLGASYGIYGPAYELAVNTARAPGEEEYLDSEKYELKAWKLDDPRSLEPLITRLNSIRRENPALQTNDLLAFHETDNDQLVAYSKRTPDRSNLVLTVVSVDPHHAQKGHLRLNLEELGIGAEDTFQVHDLLTGARYLWRGARNLVEFNPGGQPAAVFRIKRHVRSEIDFDYFT